MIQFFYDRENRLSDLRQRAASRRTHQRTRCTTRKHCSIVVYIFSLRSGSSGISREEYLNTSVWADHHHLHHEQPWVVSAMQSFHDKQLKWEHRLCSVCHEVWPTRACLDHSQATFVCSRCKRDKQEPKKISAQNDMIPCEVPPSLQGLSQVEEMLIARACPIMTVYRKHGGQRGYKGHVLNLPQDIQDFLNRLPPKVSDLLLRRSGENNTHSDLRVRRHTVLTALQWLHQNNPFYSDIVIDLVSIRQLPDDGIPSELLTVDDVDDITDSEEEDANAHSHSFLPLPRRNQLKPMQ